MAKQKTDLVDRSKVWPHYNHTQGRTDPALEEGEGSRLIRLMKRAAKHPMRNRLYVYCWERLNHLKGKV